MSDQRWVIWRCPNDPSHDIGGTLEDRDAECAVCPVGTAMARVVVVPEAEVECLREAEVHAAELRIDLDLIFEASNESFAALFHAVKRAQLARARRDLLDAATERGREAVRAALSEGGR